ncbi:LRR receptor-like serine/threonine-protein kinase GSO1 [Juglans regia]|uniref:LRR receptor-like serine/threonine-protein kinase GSO1 n=2 Tax=Juglans regia TaxID=51240 RepID=A0A2I4F9D7_JUGRE|nr:LRR receptor-like serine/threonine-protein kinase GSO1 [Juglans regia]
MDTAYYFSLLYFVTLFVAQSYLPSLVGAATLRNIASDQHALLALKARISQYDPHNVLTNNWSTSSNSVCNWVGVRCGSRHHRITALNLSYMALEGTIPPQMGNLSFLVRLNIRNNSFHSSIPKELAHLRRLKTLNFRFNDFSGEFPSWIGLLSKLQHLALHGNSFTGTIPPSLSNISSLQRLSCSINQLSGSIPSSIFNMSTLQEIYLGGNKLSGPMPSIFFDLPSLQIIDLADNDQLSGVLPMDIFDHLPNLNRLSIFGNQFSGELPSTLFRCTQLQLLSLSFNNFSRRVPPEIWNLTMLVFLDLSDNNFEGAIPSALFTCKQLQFLSLSYNNFTGRVPQEIGNLTMLVRLVLRFNNKSLYLEMLLLSDNPLNGIFPSSVGNLSTSLQYFGIGHCIINGNIPREIGNLSSLTTLLLDNNQFAGPFPTTMGTLHKLEALYLQNNKLKGSIPSDLCNLESLVELNLASNELTGGIPECMGTLNSLRNLYLAFNQLTSMVPLSLWNLTYILEVNLSSNLLVGSLPIEMGNMKVLRILDLSRNQLSGDIPTTIGAVKDLVNLSLAYNKLEGSIPEACGELVSLEFLDLSNNKLSGDIPKSLEALSYLKYLNVSFNRLQGKIPTGGPFENFSAASFMSNNALCGAPQLQVPPCKEDSPLKKKTIVVHVLKYVLPGIGLTILLVVALATQRLSLNNLLGEESFGSVYKGTLSNGLNVAIKVLNLQVEGTFKSFDVECEVLRNTRCKTQPTVLSILDLDSVSLLSFHALNHPNFSEPPPLTVKLSPDCISTQPAIIPPNLIKIISICSNIEFKALVLEYMPNGNLEKWLYSHNHYLNVLQRLNIMVDVASALEYVHYGYSTIIVHCDLKPSNILLDDDLVAHVADFGMAKLLGNGYFMMRTMTLVTIGYMGQSMDRKELFLPEEMCIVMAFYHGNFYKKEIYKCHIFRRNEFEVLDRGIITSTFGNDIIDGNLLSNERDDASMEELIYSIMRLALECCAESPEQRINVKNVSDKLHKIKMKFLQADHTDQGN